MALRADWVTKIVTSVEIQDFFIELEGALMVLLLDQYTCRELEERVNWETLINSSYRIGEQKIHYSTIHSENTDHHKGIRRVKGLIVACY